MKPQTIVQATLLTLSMTVCLPAYAENQALMTLLKALQENGTIDIQTYELVKRVALAETEDERQVVQQIAREEVSHSINEAAGKEATGKEATGKGGRPENSIRMGGRIQVDAASYREDSSRHNDGTEIRRARLFAEGDLGKAWGYKLQYDFTADGIDGIQDAYLDYKGFENLKVRMGHFKEPFSLQNMTSSKYVLFTERGLPHVFAEGRNLGLQLSRKGKNWSASAGLFGEGRDGASADNDEGFGASGRITYAPLYEKTQALHLGASASYRATGSTDTLRFRERPESHMTNTRLVDTGSIDVEKPAAT